MRLTLIAVVIVTAIAAAVTTAPLPPPLAQTKSEVSRTSFPFIAKTRICFFLYQNHSIYDSYQIAKRSQLMSVFAGAAATSAFCRWYTKPLGRFFYERDHRRKESVHDSVPVSVPVSLQGPAELEKRSLMTYIAVGMGGYWVADDCINDLATSIRLERLEKDRRSG